MYKRAEVGDKDTELIMEAGTVTSVVALMLPFSARIVVVPAARALNKPVLLFMVPTVSLLLDQL